MQFYDSSSEAKRTGLRQLLNTADETYDQVLRLFDHALDELAVLEAPSGLPPPGHDLTVHGNHVPSSFTTQTEAPAGGNAPLSSPTFPTSPAPDQLLPSCKRALPPDFEQSQRVAKRSRRETVTVFTRYSPPRTRAATRAAMACTQTPRQAAATKRNRKIAPLPLFSPPRTRVAAKAALLTAQSHPDRRSDIKASHLPVDLRGGGKKANPPPKRRRALSKTSTGAQPTRRSSRLFRSDV